MDSTNLSKRKFVEEGDDSNSAVETVGRKGPLKKRFAARESQSSDVPSSMCKPPPLSSSVSATSPAEALDITGLERAILDIPESKKKAFLEVLAINPNIVGHGELSLEAFLRRDENDAKIAAQHMVDYWENRKSMFGDAFFVSGIEHESRLQEVAVSKASASVNEEEDSRDLGDLDAGSAEEDRIKERKERKRRNDVVYARQRRVREKNEVRKLREDAWALNKRNLELREEGEVLQGMLQEALQKIVAETEQNSPRVASAMPSVSTRLEADALLKQEALLLSELGERRRSSLGSSSNPPAFASRTEPDPSAQLVDVTQLLLSAAVGGGHSQKQVLRASLQGEADISSMNSRAARKLDETGSFEVDRRLPSSQSGSRLLPEALPPDLLRNLTQADLSVVAQQLGDLDSRSGFPRTGQGFESLMARTSEASGELPLVSTGQLLDRLAPPGSATASALLLNSIADVLEGRTQSGTMRLPEPSPDSQPMHLQLPQISAGLKTSNLAGHYNGTAAPTSSTNIIRQQLALMDHIPELRSLLQSNPGPMTSGSSQQILSELQHYNPELVLQWLASKKQS